MIKKLHNLISSLFKKKYNYLFTTDIPEILKPKTIYIIQNDGYPWQIVMLCPCGCKKNLHMNLIDEYKPYWRFGIDKKNRITLYPSIHRTVGCESHFFIRKGAIIWA